MITDSSSDERPKKKKKKREKKAKREKKKNSRYYSDCWLLPPTESHSLTRLISTGEDCEWAFLVCFKATYNRMVPEKKWILCSGRAVEDVIYSYASILDKQIVAHLFILDPEDELVKGLFTVPEWLEIVSQLESRKKTLQDTPRPDCLDWVPSDVSWLSSSLNYRNTSPHLVSNTGEDDQTTPRDSVRI